MKRIILTIDSLNSGGAQRQLVLLANYLSNFYEVYIIYYSDKNFFKNKLNKKIHLILAQNKIDFIKKITFYIKQKNIHCVISYLNTPNILTIIASILCGYKRVIISERGEHVLISFNRFIILKILSMRVKYLIVNSEFLFKRFKEKKIKNLIFIPNFIETKEKNTIKETVKSEKLKIGILARFEPEKNQYFIIEQEIKNKFNRITYHFAGRITTEYFKKCNFYFKNYPDKFYAYGNITNIEEFISKMDFIIIPSIRESFSNVLIEAYMNNTPVVASHSGDNGKLILNNKTGFIYKTEQEYIKIMEKITKMDKKSILRMGIEGKKYILKHYYMKAEREYRRLLYNL